MPLASGTALTHFEILGPLGAGGMGEVYRARDTRLDREVAIKVLPDQLADDDERLRRFEREARTLASLNHPNLAHVYGIDQMGETCFIAMELVPGEDLAAKLARGRLPIDEAVDLCRQVAEGLEAAHEAGVVHRDLKPANVRVTPEGVAKVLDFGLAKPIGPRATKEGTTTAESDSFLVTEEGLVLGTPTYMSPEQARGKPVDRRTDVWAFGCVLYECLTGKRAFGGESLTDVLAAIVDREPDWSALPAGTPPSARRVLERTLDKDPRTRLRDIGEARIALDGGDDEAPAASGRRRSIAVAALALALGLSVGALLGRHDASTAAPRLPRTLQLPAPGIDAAGFGSAISPDGKYVAYVGEEGIRLVSLESTQTIDMEGTDGAQLLAWSPDSSAIAFFAEAALWRVPREGGSPSRICRLDSNWVPGAGLAWGPGDTIVFASGFESLYGISANGGELHDLVVAQPSVEEHFHAAAFLPDADGETRSMRLVYAVHDVEGVDTLEVLDAGERKQILQLPGGRLGEPCWSPTGHIVFMRRYEGTGVWAMPFSLARMEATGEPFLVAASASHPTVSIDGALVYFLSGESGGDTLGWIDEEGALERFGEERGLIDDPALSPNGQYVAAVVREQDAVDIYVHDVRRGTWTAVTDTKRAKRRPRWISNDELVFSESRFTGGDDVYRVSAHGTGTPVLVAEDAAAADVSEDGRWLVFEGADFLMRLDLEQTGEPVVIGEAGIDGSWPALSPDGRWLAYRSSLSVRPEVYLTRFPSGDGRWQVSVAGGRFPRWSPDGDRIFFTEPTTAPSLPTRLFGVSVTAEPELTLGVPEPVFSMDHYYATDFDTERRRFLAAVRGREREVAAHPLRLALDWEAGR